MSDSNKKVINTPEEKERVNWSPEKDEISEKKLDIPISTADNTLGKIKHLINDTELQHQHLLVPDFDIEDFVSDAEIRHPELSVEISKDGLEAYISYMPVPQYVNITNLKHSVTKLSLNETPIYANQLKKEIVYEVLRDNGVLYGIIPEKINEMCSLNKHGKYLVAKALLPVDPVDDIFEILFKDKNDSASSLKEDSLEKVDYKNSHEYICFKPGEVIAKIYKGDKGAKGIKVTGEFILQKEYEKIIIQPNNSIHIEETENIIFIRAARSGKPLKTITEDGKICLNVVNKLVLEEVNIKTGNVNFNGDLEISGDIQESMKVIAKNNINIGGNVCFSTVFCGNSVFVEKSIISSKIVAGTGLQVLSKLIPTIEKIIVGLKGLINNMRVLSPMEVRTNNLTNISDIIYYLIKTKNSSILTTIQDFIAGSKEEKSDQDNNFLHDIIHKMKAINSKTANINHINYIYELISDLENLLKTRQDGVASGDVHVQSVLNSQITASGNVIIDGTSCVNSNIYANGIVAIKGNLRGGEIFAEKKVIAGKVGSDLGIRSVLAVGEGGIIMAKAICPDTTVKVGKLIHMFLKETPKVSIRAIGGKIFIE